MSKFTGANVRDITKIKNSDVFIKVDLTVVGMVSVPQSIIDNGDALPLGTLLSSRDGGLTWTSLTAPIYETGVYVADKEVYHEGHIFKSTVADNSTVPGVGDWDDLGVWDSNGVLYNDLTESKKTTIVVTGSVKEKYLHGSDEFLRTTLFKNKIIAK
ncbi:hypothetical protein [Sulfurimonas sp.]|uniref:hypothetical protein n=1 Tax=Sulfurimonas sp. TaxID=2022749 RepID=UPI0025FF16A0|nr:hypothetical protein [Sulfurimonas sp.]